MEKVSPNFGKVRLIARKANPLERFRYRQAWRKSEFYFISFPKSGRTWVKAILARYFALLYDVPPFGDFSPLLRLGNRKHVPRIMFSHYNNRAPDFELTRNAIKNSFARKVVFLARDPRNIVITYYYRLVRRMRDRQAAATPLKDFVRDPVMGMPRIIEFINAWCVAGPDYDDFMLLRYEDILDDPPGEIARLLKFLGQPLNNDLLCRAIDESNDTTRNIEKHTIPGLPRPATRDVRGHRSPEQRKWNLPGYRDYLSPDDIEYLELQMKRLDNSLGYRSL